MEFWRKKRQTPSNWRQSGANWRWWWKSRREARGRTWSLQTSVSFFDYLHINRNHLSFPTSSDPGTPLPRSPSCRTATYGFHSLQSTTAITYCTRKTSSILCFPATRCHYTPSGCSTHHHWPSWWFRMAIQSTTAASLVPIPLPECLIHRVCEKWTCRCSITIESWIRDLRLFRWTGSISIWKFCGWGW